ncbi:MAG: apolipoprotein N-acyltransferase [Clostridiales bacterium]|nr:apolipoprotein N-acyltransferase [Clostridiales bacterium]
MKDRTVKIYNALYSRNALWCFIAGIIYSLSFVRGYLFLFGFFGLILFYLKLFEGKDTLSVTSPFKKAFFFGLGFFIPLYSWFFVLYPFEAFEFTKIQGMFIVIIADIGLSLYHSLILAICFLLFKIFPKNRYLLPLGAGCVFLLFEWVISLGSFSLPWGTAAAGQYLFLPLIQNASLMGGLFIAFIINLFSSATAVFLKQPDKKYLLYPALSICVPLLTGTVLLALPSGNQTAIKTAALQGNVLSMEKWGEERLDSIIDRYEKLALEAAGNGAELIVLPESAIPTSYSPVIGERFSAISREKGVTIIMSVITNEGDKKYNSVFALFADGSMSEIYSKRHLVPFGEYLPAKELIIKLFPFVSDLNLSETPFTPGENPVITLKDGTKVGCLVCFDSIFPPLALDSARAGAELMLVSTNDSWYEDSAGVYQHMSHSVIRAVETGKWLVRSANTGISCFVSPKGVVYSQTSPLTQTIAYQTVYTNTNRTLYSRVGDIIVILPFAFVIFSLIYKLKEKDKRNGNSETI